MKPKDLPTIHVYFGDEHSNDYCDDCLNWICSLPGGAPYLLYEEPTDRHVANLERLLAGRSNRGDLPRGWVLHYEASWCEDRREEGEPPGKPGDNPDDYTTGIAELTAVDEAVAAAQKWLNLAGYREPAT
jgi:hypothetical protein